MSTRSRGTDVARRGDHLLGLVFIDKGRLAVRAERDNAANPGGDPLRDVGGDRRPSTSPLRSKTVAIGGNTASSLMARSVPGEGRRCQMMQELGVRSQESGVRSQESGDRRQDVLPAGCRL